MCCDLDACDWPTVRVGGVHTSFVAAWGSQETSRASWSAASSVHVDMFLNELVSQTAPSPKSPSVNRLQVSALQAVTTTVFFAWEVKDF